MSKQHKDYCRRIGVKHLDFQSTNQYLEDLNVHAIKRKNTLIYADVKQYNIGQKEKS